MTNAKTIFATNAENGDHGDQLEIDRRIYDTQEKLLASAQLEKDQHQVILTTNARLHKLQATINLLEIKYHGQQQTLEHTTAMIVALREQEELKNNELREIENQITAKQVDLMAVDQMVEKKQFDISEKEQALLDLQLSLAQTEEKKCHQEKTLELMTSELESLECMRKIFSDRSATLTRQIEQLIPEVVDQNNQLDLAQMAYRETIGQLLQQEEKLATLEAIINSKEQALRILDQQQGQAILDLSQMEIKIKDKTFHLAQIDQMITFNRQQLANQQARQGQMSVVVANLQASVEERQLEMEQLSQQDQVRERNLGQIFEKLEKQFFNFHRLGLEQNPNFSSELDLNQLQQLETVFFDLGIQLEQVWGSNITFGIGVIHGRGASNFEIQVAFAIQAQIPAQHQKEILFAAVRKMQTSFGRANGIHFRVVSQLDLNGFGKNSKISFSLKTPCPPVAISI